MTSPMDTCGHALPSGESVPDAVARHMGITTEALTKQGITCCEDLHPLARVLGAASFIADADRTLHAATAAPDPDGAPRWTLTLAYALTLICLAASCGLLGRAVL
jgi:hypothetical protein